MNKKSMILIMTLVLLTPIAGIAFSTQVSAPLTANTLTALNPVAADEVARSREIPLDIEKLLEMVPQTIEEAEAQIYPLPNRFLMWTHDGRHIMWGYYRNGYFVGTDNLGKRCWGIYGKGVFAGFYDGEFFYGRYGNGRWRAVDLFGENHTHGRYVLFPAILDKATAESLP